MPLTTYFQDPREETRRPIFLKFVVTQCCSAAEKADPVSQKILEDLRTRIVLAIESLENGADNEPVALPDPSELFKRLMVDYRAIQDIYPPGSRSLIRPALRRMVRRFGAFRRGELVRNGRRWQCPVTAPLPNPNPTLKWYLREIEPVIGSIADAYERALGEALDVHVNLAILPKDRPDGATNGVTLRRETDKRSNPAPVDREPDRIVRVELKLPTKFDKASAFMIPYTIAHEFGVHALQQLDLEDAPNAEEGKWLFSEGFMDAVITDLLADILNRLAQEHLFNKMRRKAALLRHRKRLVEEMPTAALRRKNLWQEQLVEGSRCWDRIKDVAGLAGEARLSAPPREWAFDVALKLNALPLAVDERENFLKGFLASISYFPDGISLPEGDVVRHIEVADSKRPHPFDLFFGAFCEIGDIDDREYLAHMVRSLTQELPECQSDFLD